MKAVGKGVWHGSLMLFAFMINIANMCTPQGEELPFLDTLQRDILINDPFLDALQMISQKCYFDERYFVYIKKLFDERAQSDLLTEKFMRIIQGDTRNMSTDDEELCHQFFDSVLKSSTVGPLFFRAHKTYLASKSSTKKIKPYEAVIGDILAKMPSDIKKQLLFYQQRDVLFADEKERAQYLAQSKYAFLAMLVSGLLFTHQRELFEDFEREINEFDGGRVPEEALDYFCDKRESSGKKLEDIAQERADKLINLCQLLYESLGDGQRYKIALYSIISELCEEEEIYESSDEYFDESSDEELEGPVPVVRSISAPALHNEVGEAGECIEKSNTFSFTPFRKREGKCTIQEIVDQFCPDVHDELRSKYNIYRIYSEARGVPQLSRDDSCAGVSDSTEVPVCFKVAQKMSDMLTLSSATQEALRVPHLHIHQLYNRGSQRDAQEKIQQLIELKAHYPSYWLANRYFEKKVQEVLLRFWCNEYNASDDIYKLTLQFIYPDSHLGLHAKRISNYDDEAYISSDGIEDWISDEKDGSGCKMPVLKHMQPVEVAQLLSKALHNSDMIPTIMVSEQDVKKSYAQCKEKAVRNVVAHNASFWVDGKLKDEKNKWYSKGNMVFFPRGRAASRQSSNIVLSPEERHEFIGFLEQSSLGDTLEDEFDYDEWDPEDSKSLKNEDDFLKKSDDSLTKACAIHSIEDLCAYAGLVVTGT